MNEPSSRPAHHQSEPVPPPDVPADAALSTSEPSASDLKAAHLSTAEPSVSEPAGPAGSAGPTEADQQTRRPAGAEPQGASRRTRVPSRKELRAAEPKPVTGAQRAIGATLGRPRPKGRAALALAAGTVAALILIPTGVFLAHGRPGPASQVTASVTLDADVPLADALEVSGRLGSVPVLSLRGVLTAPEQPVTDTLITGQGRQVAEGDAVLLSVSVFSGQDGTNLTGGSGRTCYRGVATSAELGEDLTRAVVGSTEGSRLVLRESVTAQDGSAFPEVTVIDILPTLATGTPEDPSQASDGAALPAVSVAEDGSVSVSLEGLAAPSRGTSAVLVRGDGQQVQADDDIIARYQVVSWSDSQVRTSSYGHAVVPGIIHLSDTFAGLAQRLTDVSVGSRVVVALPADEARGEDALAIVVDVLAVSDSSQPVATSVPSDVVKVVPSATPTVPASGS